MTSTTFGTSASHVHLARLAALGEDRSEDYAGLSQAEVLAIRTNGDHLRIAPATGFVRSLRGSSTRASSKLPSGVVRYVMSTQKPVGRFGDVILVKGWNLVDFFKRGRPFLFSHNIDEYRVPLGRMSHLLKGAEEDFVGGEPTLSGNANFTPAGLNSFNDSVHDMVVGGWMSGGSVGFRILDSRSPTDEEMEANARLRKFSAIITKASLVEFSAVPVGQDPDATAKPKRRSERLSDLQFDELLRGALGEGAPSLFGGVDLSDVEIVDDEDEPKEFDEDEAVALLAFGAALGFVAELDEDSDDDDDPDAEDDRAPADLYDLLLED